MTVFDLGRDSDLARRPAKLRREQLEEIAEGVLQRELREYRGVARVGELDLGPLHVEAAITEHALDRFRDLQRLLAVREVHEQGRAGFEVGSIALTDVAMATRNRSSGVIRWSWSSSPASSCTQLILPVNALVGRGVVVAHRRAGVAADVARLVGGVDHRDGRLGAPVAALGAVDVERDVPALGQAAAVVGELHAHLMRAGRNRRVAVDLEALQPEQVVAVGRLALVQVERPTRERAALGDDDAVGSAVGHDDLGRDRVRLVLEVDHRVLGEATHAAVEDLRLALHELGPARDVGVEALDPAVVERQDVVLDRFDQEQPLQLVQASRGVRLARSCACDQSVLVS